MEESYSKLVAIVSLRNSFFKHVTIVKHAYLIWREKPADFNRMTQSQEYSWLSLPASLK